MRKEFILTRKKFYLLLGISLGSCATAFITIILAVIFFNVNNSKINSNYQTIKTEFDSVDAQFSIYGEKFDLASQVDGKLQSMEKSLDQIEIDFESLKTKTNKNEEDIFYIQTVVSDKNLDSLLDSLNTKVTNNEIELDTIRTLQKSQQSKLDDIIKSFSDFKEMIITKVTSMLSKSSNSTSKTMSSINTTKNINFNYVLNSIEYRSGEQWAVFAPKTIRSLSELRFLTVGDTIDNWRVATINDTSVLLTQGNIKHQVTL